MDMICSSRITDHVVTTFVFLYFRAIALFSERYALFLRERDFQDFSGVVLTCNDDLFRRMFPSVQLTVNGLEEHEHYYILLEIQPACTRRYKYCGNSATHEDENGNKSNIGGWSFAGPAEPQPRFDRRIYMHPDGPATGNYWMQNTISFSKLKLTNNVVDHRNNVRFIQLRKWAKVRFLHIRFLSSWLKLSKSFSHFLLSFNTSNLRLWLQKIAKNRKGNVINSSFLLSSQKPSLFSLYHYIFFLDRIP